MELHLNTESDLHSDKCNQYYQNCQNDKFLNYNLHLSAMNTDDKYCNSKELSKIPNIKTHVKHQGSSFRGSNIISSITSLADTINTENHLLRLNRTLSNCPNLNDPNKDKMCKSNEIEDINLYTVSTRISDPIYDYRGVNLHSYDKYGRNLNRIYSVTNNRPRFTHCISIGTDTKQAEKDNYTLKRNDTNN